MMKSATWRWVLTLAVLGMALFVSFRVMTHMQSKSEATASVPVEEQEADAWIKGFSYRQTRSGKTKWVVTADQAKVFEDENKAQLQKVNVQLIDDDSEKVQLKIISDEGVMDTSKNDFELASQDRQTVISFEQGYRVFSERFSWNERLKHIHTKDPVRIEGNDMVITGIGLVGDIEKNEFRLLKKVRVEMLSP